jgi:predicted SAM-dependent methyltransferase
MLSMRLNLLWAKDMKLHIGGWQSRDDWKILDILPRPGADFLGSITDLSKFESGSIEAIYASHVLEHVSQNDMANALAGIIRVLIPGGTFMASVPDLDVLSHLFISPSLSIDQKFHVMRMIFGGQTDAADFHYIGLNHQILHRYLQNAGFGRIERVRSFGLFTDTSELETYGQRISLNMIAVK